MTAICIFRTLSFVCQMHCKNLLQVCGRCFSFVYDVFCLMYVLSLLFKLWPWGNVFATQGHWYILVDFLPDVLTFTNTFNIHVLHLPILSWMGGLSSHFSYVDDPSSEHHLMAHLLPPGFIMSLLSCCIFYTQSSVSGSTSALFIYSCNPAFMPRCLNWK